MNGYNLLRNILMAGEICSVIITLISIVLFLNVLRSNKYIDKPIKETPLLRYSKILLAGILSTAVFSISYQLLLILHYY